jgi:signal peptidase II
MKGRTIFFAVIALMVAADFTTKHLACVNLEPGKSVSVINGAVCLTLVLNKGLLFGVMPADNQAAAIIFSFAVLAALFFLTPKFFPEKHARTGSAFLIGGITGNLIDRIRLGYIVDFLDIKVWPVFNLSDVFICAGIGFMILYTIKPARN